MKLMRSLFLFTLLAAICFCQNGADPWPKADLLEPAVLAQAIQSPNPPVVVAVPFPVLYRSKHILHAIDGGTGSKPEGIETLKKAVANLSKDADIVVYCGCAARWSSVRTSVRIVPSKRWASLMFACLISRQICTRLVQQELSIEPGSL